jgi:hypothetical protein
MIVSLFQVSWAAWMIIGMTIIMVLVNYMLFSLYKHLSPKINKLALILGLGLGSLIMELAWLVVVVLLTSR